MINPQQNPASFIESFYNKYAAPIYGTICRLTPDRLLADQIFKDAFIAVIQKQQPINLFEVLRETHAFTVKRVHGYTGDIEKKEKQTILKLLSTCCYNLQHAANKLNLDEAQARRQLRTELLSLRKELV